MTLSEELVWRGLVNQTTFEKLQELDDKQWTFYHGFDASADSQAVGNLAAMMLDKVFIRHGHTAILLAGGATSLIGDPGGKDSERPMQSEETIRHNIDRAEEQLKKIFAGQDFRLVNNLDWTKDMKVLDFLRDIGKHFTMTSLLQRDYIASRIGEEGSGISYTEFSYTLLQGLDYLHLYDEFGCSLQLGGADQWGNCLSGVELIRRKRGAEVHVITLPLVINKATGKKFGKSEEGAVWLDPDKTSVYAFYQFWLNVDDEGVESYLKIFTELNKPEVEDIMQRFRADPSSRLAQKTLAYEVTRIVHGVERAESVKRVTETLFGNGEYEALTPDDVLLLRTELPSAQLASADDLVTALTATGLASSNSEARRFIEQGAVYLNGKPAITGQAIDAAGTVADGYVILRRGKNSNAVIRVN